jgi:hypothetical protein
MRPHEVAIDDLHRNNGVKESAEENLQVPAMQRAFHLHYSSWSVDFVIVDLEQLRMKKTNLTKQIVL